MFFYLSSFFLINLFFYTINALPLKIYGRPVGSRQRDDLPYGGWGGGSSNPSGAIPGAYYGSGVNPNYGSVGPNTNDADIGIDILTYGQGYSSNNVLAPHWNPYQSQQYQQYNLYSSNYNNAWQRPNNNNYYNRPYNRYPPGSQGWYATGGNYWYNQASSNITNILLLIGGIVICSFMYIKE